MLCVIKLACEFRWLDYIAYIDIVPMTMANS